jgi:proteasome accessory factor C
MSESASDRLARVLALVPWLRANDGITITEAAEHFGVSSDQLTTDLWQLIVCGIPGYGPDQLVDIQFWDDDVIHVVDAIALERPLRLTGEEAAALHVALRVLAQVPGNQHRHALVSAMAKLEPALQDSNRAVLDVHVTGDEQVASVIESAVSAGSALTIGYASGARDEVTRRTIRPLGSYLVDGHVYVDAWCETAQGHRTFRLDRIQTAVLADTEPAEPPIAGVASTTIPRTPHPQDTSVAHIAIDPAAMWIWDTEPVTEMSAADGSRAAISYASLDWLVRWVLGFGGLVTVLDPPEAKEALRRAAEARLGQG